MSPAQSIFAVSIETERLTRPGFRFVGRSVAAIKTGFQAQVGQRKLMAA